MNILNFENNIINLVNQFEQLFEKEKDNIINNDSAEKYYDYFNNQLSNIKIIAYHYSKQYMENDFIDGLILSDSKLLKEKIIYCANKLKKEISTEKLNKIVKKYTSNHLYFTLIKNGLNFNDFSIFGPYSIRAIWDDIFGHNSHFELKKVGHPIIISAEIPFKYFDNTCKKIIIKSIFTIWINYKKYNITDKKIVITSDIYINKKLEKKYIKKEIY